MMDPTPARGTEFLTPQQEPRLHLSLWEFLLQTGELTRTILSLLEIPQTAATFSLRLISRDFRHGIPDAVTELIIPYKYVYKVKSEYACDDWIRHIACACRHLQTVDLDYSEVTDDGMELLVAHCAQLRIVRLTYSSDLTDAGFIPLVTACGKNLQELGLAIRLTDASLEALVAHATNLRTVVINLTCGVTDAGLEALAIGCKNLQELEIVQTNITEGEGIKALAIHAKNLQKLTYDGCTDEGLIHLAKHAKNIRSLYLQPCEKEVYDEDGQEVDIYDLYITDEGLEELGKHAKNLRELNIIAHAISATGVAALAQGCMELEYLNIGYCYVTDKAVEALMKHSKKLRLLETSGTRVTPEMEQKWMAHLSSLESK